MTSPDHVDVAIVGAGVIGLAIAQRLSAAPGLSGRTIVLLEQEADIGQHISSRNSEVVHAGIYYPPGSLKASLCVRGRRLLYEHCAQYHLPCRQLGKLIVGSHRDAAALEALQLRGVANGVDDLQMLSSGAIRALESEVRASVALLSPSSGIVDAHEFMTSLLHLSRQQGVTFAPRTRVTAVLTSANGFSIETLSGGYRSESEYATAATAASGERYTFQAATLVNCAGLEAGDLARCIDGVAQDSIPPMYLCKGDYFTYRRPSPFRRLIYPLPEANTAGLGIHATLDMGGQLRFGPDTAYIQHLDYDVDDNKRQVFTRAIRNYFPAIKAADLLPGYAGIRPKITGPDQPPADFLIQSSRDHGIAGLVQLFGIESPGLTASLAIGDLVTRLIRDSL